ncbi:MAG TPA: xanthine dehydrogenase family protein molybdopterin-binding subunit, partial [Candidatus Xenobia bacterium]
MTTVVGQPIDRADGVLKVSGQARYAADYQVAGAAYAVPLVSRIARGRVVSIDMPPMPGVLLTITRQNALPLHHPDINFMTATKPGERRLLFEDDVIHYQGQYIGCVVAETLEIAQHAALTARVEYREEAPQVHIDKSVSYEPEEFFGERLRYARGDASSGLREAAVVVAERYTTPVEHHNPMEPSATIAVWEGEELTLYDATQWVVGARNVVAQTLGVSPDQVRIVSSFVGGGFGCKGFVWGHTVLAALAARMAGRPVKLVLSRQAMFTATGHRAETQQELTLGATSSGELTAIRHVTWTQTSTVEEFIERAGVAAPFLYRCPNVDVQHFATRVNLATPGPMRAPGESPGLFAYESALDELAWKLHVDPLELRRRNFASRHEQRGMPWSSNHLLQCYDMAAARFGWSRRPAAPRSLRDGHYWLGQGMATATYPGMKSPGAAIARMEPDGRVVIRSATQDMGTGTYTTLAQLASDVLQVPMDRIRVELGDSRLPPAPVSGGSMTTASVGPAVQGAAQVLLLKLAEMAAQDSQSPLYAAPVSEILAAGDGLRRNGASESYAALLARNGGAAVEGESQTWPGEEMAKYAFQSFGCTFVEIAVDAELGEVRVQRVVAAYDVGRVINAKTARSQMIGGIIQGLGMALMEHTVYDGSGRVVTPSLADYLIPVNADVPDIEVMFVGQPD